MLKNTSNFFNLVISIVQENCEDILWKVPLFGTIMRTVYAVHNNSVEWAHRIQIQ